ncbi:hypothetical protein TIFTF001_027424 [Ficus carica]|uniref:Uncharacterized protein n=1 Tax=Ficus carica TaxID=3494 RepID=A0AA88IZL3_FICCA|nr:hypothetical protein TIFTF001_027424 [Ficus carica]
MEFRQGSDCVVNGDLELCDDGICYSSFVESQRDRDLLASRSDCSHDLITTDGMPTNEDDDKVRLETTTSQTQQG